MLKKIIKYFSYLFILILLGIAAILTTILIVNKSVDNVCKVECYNDTSKIPQRKVALVLGTAPYLVGGGNNPYFTYRMNATAELYKAGKINTVLVSGDSNLYIEGYYDEVSAMKDALVKKGIPADKIYKDHAGFRTFDSIVRAKEVFQQDNFVIVSQPFHNARALYIAKHYGMENVIAFNAKDVSQYYGFKTNLREKLARIKMLLDLYVLKTEPKFLGEPIFIKDE